MNQAKRIFTKTEKAPVVPGATSVKLQAKPGQHGFRKDYYVWIAEMAYNIRRD